MAKLILSVDGQVLKEYTLSKERTLIGRKPVPIWRSLTCGAVLPIARGRCGGWSPAWGSYCPDPPVAGAADR